MGTSRKDKLQGVVLSLPTFNDDKFNLQLPPPAKAHPVATGPGPEGRQRRLHD